MINKDEVVKSIVDNFNMSNVIIKNIRFKLT